MHSTSQNELDGVFRDMCYLLLSKCATDSVLVIFNGTRNQEVLHDYGMISNMLPDVGIAPSNTYRETTNAGVHYDHI